MGIIHCLLTRVVRFEEIEFKCSFKGLGQIKLLLVLLTVVRDRTNGWGRVWPLCRKQLSSAPQRTPVVVNSGENLRAATEAMHIQETENMGWGWNSVVHSKNDKE